MAIYQSHYFSPVYDDVKGHLYTAKLRGNSDPVFTELPGATYNFAWVFSVGNEIFVQIQLPHAYKEGTDLRPHLHLLTNDTNWASRTGKFQLDYVIIPVNETTGAEQTINTIVYTPTAQNKQEIVSCGTITGTTLQISDLLFFRVSRIATTGTELTNLYILDFDCHIQKDSDGSLSL